jgi:ATP-binding cassette subfamily A (ABC1) protein 3
MLYHSSPDPSYQHSPSRLVDKRTLISPAAQIEFNPLTPCYRFMVVIYLTAFMNINVRSPPDKVPSQLLLVHFALGLITPIGQLLREFLVGLILFSITCTGSPPIKATNPGALTLYGGPILYLIGQSLFLFGLLIWSDHGFSLRRSHKYPPQHNLENTATREPEVSEEIYRVSTAHDGLRVLHISKSFKSVRYGKVTAVDDLTLGVKQGEVFALVGPNGGMSIPLSPPSFDNSLSDTPNYSR